MAKKKKVTEELLEELENLVEEIQESEVLSESTHFAVVAEEDYPKQMTIEESMLEYISRQKENEVRINDFFTSLFTLPEAVATSKMIKDILVKANNEKKIKIVNNRHFELGITYYDVDGKAHKYNISNIEIFIEK
jgi:hypothetical protein